MNKVCNNEKSKNTRDRLDGHQFNRGVYLLPTPRQTALMLALGDSLNLDNLDSQIPIKKNNERKTEKTEKTEKKQEPNFQNILSFQNGTIVDNSGKQGRDFVTPDQYYTSQRYEIHGNEVWVEKKEYDWKTRKWSEPKFKPSYLIVDKGNKLKSMEKDCDFEWCYDKNGKIVSEQQIKFGI